MRTTLVRIQLAFVSLVLLGTPSAWASEGQLGGDYALDAGWRAALNQIKREMAAAPPGTEFIYLSGPISTGGLGSVQANLDAGKAAAAQLRAAGHHVISPFELETARLSAQGPVKHATYMRIWSEVLADPRVGRVVLMPGAETSLGAAQEIGLFISRGGKISTFTHADDGKGFHLTPYRYRPQAARLEHTVLGVDATPDEIAREARWAARSGVRAMVVRPEHTEAVARGVSGSRTIPTSVIGFPRAKFASLAGYAHVPTAEKIADAKLALDGMQRGGARVGELDMILDVHALKDGHYAAVEQDIKDVIAAADQHGKALGVKPHVKVIVETSLLTPNEIKMAAGIVRNTNALAIKTSTGYGPRGASTSDLATINRVIAGTKLVKVSGGVSPTTLPTFANRGDIFGMSRTREVLAGKAKAPRAARGGY